MEHPIDLTHTVRHDLEQKRTKGAKERFLDLLAWIPLVILVAIIGYMLIDDVIESSWRLRLIMLSVIVLLLWANWGVFRLVNRKS